MVERSTKHRLSIVGSCCIHVMMYYTLHPVKKLNLIGPAQLKPSSQYAAQLCDAATQLVMWHVWQFVNIVHVRNGIPRRTCVVPRTATAKIEMKFIFEAHAMQQVSLPHRVVEWHIVN